MALELQFELWEGEPLAAPAPAVATLSLLSYTADFQLAYGGYIPEVGTDEGKVIDVITLRVKSTTHDALATALQSMATRARQAQFGSSGYPYEYTLWLRTKLTNETNARYAFVFDVRMQPKSSMYSRTTLTDKQIKEYEIVVTRSPFWEPGAAVEPAISASTTINCLGGTGTLSSIAGDVGARIRYMKLSDTNEGAAIERLWFGFIGANNYPYKSLFLPVWNIYLGTEDAAYDTTTAADATAKAATRVQCDFATVATMAQRSRVRIKDIYAAGNEKGAIGKFLVLGRFKKTVAGDVIRVRLSTGLYGSDNFMSFDRVLLNSSDTWFLYELGIVQFPLCGQPPHSLSALGGETLRLEAERKSGSGSLYADVYILIPIAECYAVSRSLDMAFGGTVRSFYYSDYHTGREAVVRGDSSTTYDKIADFQLYGRLPVGDSTLVVAGQSSTSSSLTNEVNFVDFYIKNRWRELRGSS